MTVTESPTPLPRNSSLRKPDPGVQQKANTERPPMQIQNVSTKLPQNVLNQRHSCRYQIQDLLSRCPGRHGHGHDHHHVQVRGHPDWGCCRHANPHRTHRLERRHRPGIRDFQEETLGMGRRYAFFYQVWLRGSCLMPFRCPWWKMDVQMIHQGCLYRLSSGLPPVCSLKLW